MSLVDYASSSDDEDAEIKAEHKEINHGTEVLKNDDWKSSTPPQAPSIAQNQTRLSFNQKPEILSHLPSPPVEKLPDASLLLSSPMSQQSIGSGHDARVAAALAENASRKREANESGPSVRNKMPRGSFCTHKNIPDTGGGGLVPPQLRGRSNVVTEDINKLFVNRHPKGSA